MDFAKWLIRSMMISCFWLSIGASDFKFYWNIPSFMCHPYQIKFDTLLAEYGIIQNEKDSFRGDQISILYDPGSFPAILQNSSSKEFMYRNHGVPQEGNLTEHLQIFEMQLEKLIPNADFSGFAIIDFESWRPIYSQNFGTLQPYKTLSMQIEQKYHPEWTKKEIEKEAEIKFEIGAKTFMLETLLKAKQMRPRGKWGYYGFPFCFNNGNGDNPGKCTKTVHDQNNMIQWMFQSSDAIYPSVYMQENTPVLNRIPFVRAKTREAVRVAEMTSNGKQEPKVLVYHRYMFSDTSKYLDMVTTLDVFKEVKYAGADGIILWGSSKNLNSRTKCQQFHSYVKKILGPAARLAAKTT